VRSAGGDLGHTSELTEARAQGVRQAGEQRVGLVQLAAAAAAAAGVFNFNINFNFNRRGRRAVGGPAGA
jgi:hypothetical protein